MAGINKPFFRIYTLANIYNFSLAIFLTSMLATHFISHSFNMQDSFPQQDQFPSFRNLEISTGHECMTFIFLFNGKRFHLEIMKSTCEEMEATRRTSKSSRMNWMIRVYSNSLKIGLLRHYLNVSKHLRPSSRLSRQPVALYFNTLRHLHSTSNLLIKMEFYLLSKRILIQKYNMILPLALGSLIRYLVPTNLEESLSYFSPRCRKPPPSSLRRSNMLLEVLRILVPFPGRSSFLDQTRPSFSSPHSVTMGAGRS